VGNGARLSLVSHSLAVTVGLPCWRVGSTAHARQWVRQFYQGNCTNRSRSDRHDCYACADLQEDHGCIPPAQISDRARSSCVRSDSMPSPARARGFSSSEDSVDTGRGSMSRASVNTVRRGGSRRRSRAVARLASAATTERDVLNSLRSEPSTRAWRCSSTAGIRIINSFRWSTGKGFAPPIRRPTGSADRDSSDSGKPHRFVVCSMNR
jgi:hypothetical protein